LVSPRHHRLESRMREIRPSGLEGGVARKRHPYPYRRADFQSAEIPELNLAQGSLASGGNRPFLRARNARAPARGLSV
ncbi:MAG TPA: hypothetical protein VFE51_19760, partial [Verrucomicrobiae bacterium]|nr:hypothetical protein [Verrucomicrobiae bacterium]